jgi:hypothetical protein
MISKQHGAQCLEGNCEWLMGFVKKWMRGKDYHKEFPVFIEQQEEITKLKH